METNGEARPRNVVGEEVMLLVVAVALILYALQVVEAGFKSVPTCSGLLWDGCLLIVKSAATTSEDTTARQPKDKTSGY
jgi:hypothetical protein